MLDSSWLSLYVLKVVFFMGENIEAKAFTVFKSWANYFVWSTKFQREAHVLACLTSQCLCDICSLVRLFNFPKPEGLKKGKSIETGW